MLDKISDNILKWHKATLWSIEYMEITEDRSFQKNQIFLCHTHTSVIAGVGGGGGSNMRFSSNNTVGYASDDEIMMENHIATDNIVTTNTGFIEFFGISPSSKGYLITILEKE
jgi:hypothetical protein